MAKIKFQAREIFRAAKRQGITMKRSSFYQCAIGVICGVENLPCADHRTELAKAMKVKRSNLIALEIGFEGWDEHTNYVWDHANISGGEVKRLMKNRYYKVGRNLAKLAGLD